MNTLKHTIKQALSNGSNNKPKHPLMYKGYILKSKRTNKGYKIQAYNYKTDIFLNPLYNDFKSIKLVIDNIKE